LRRKKALPQLAEMRDTPSGTMARRAIRQELDRRTCRKRQANVVRGGWMTEQGEVTGINDVARMLNVTPRTLRFYEDKGLITPCRAGAIRVYTKRQIARMQLILRGKRLGFSLRDIEEFLDLYDADPQHVEQMRALAERCRQRIELLESQRTAIAETLAELETIERQALARVPTRRERQPRTQEHTGLHANGQQ
jgi:DNA-binding transcriptional MerR regulator